MNLKVSTTLPDCTYRPHNWEVALLDSCERSQTVGGDSGWHPLYFSNNDHFSWGHIKNHSYGEFIFDWAWADLYQRVGLSYYPKLIHALPFTPVNAKKFFGNNPRFVLESLKNFYLNQDVISSDHWLFVEEELKSEFLELGYFHQKTIQYHFFNHFDSFDDFMNSLKMRKRKQIKKERAAVSSSLLHIKKVCCADLTADELDQVYQLYLSTIEKKHSLAYLNKNFFYQLQNLMSEHVFFFMAYEQETLIAMSMFIETDSTLFGRYWGIFPEYEKQYSFLHFELCYYRGIEYCIDCKLEKFEAGAQGEQKLLRGFKPVMIHSFHHIKNVELSKVIENHVHSMNHKVELEVERLAEYLPYKKDSEI